MAKSILKKSVHGKLNVKIPAMKTSCLVILNHVRINEASQNYCGSARAIYTSLSSIEKYFPRMYILISFVTIIMIEYSYKLNTSSSISIIEEKYLLRMYAIISFVTIVIIEYSIS